MPDFALKKGERLSSRKTISTLFQEGKVIKAYPLRILYCHAEQGQYPASVTISVPKRLFKRAVDRNLLKRRIREAYRLNKPVFYSGLMTMDQQVFLVIQYQHREIVDYQTIQTGLHQALEKLLRQLSKQ
ncbi:MAG: ribonuclease P protein component [Bacteroidales bacterium]|nr:ribonuclease P protein component [Bacteroidales bacterium]